MAMTRPAAPNLVSSPQSLERLTVDGGEQQRDAGRHHRYRNGSSDIDTHHREQRQTNTKQAHDDHELAGIESSHEPHHEKTEDQEDDETRLQPVSGDLVRHPQGICGRYVQGVGPDAGLGGDVKYCATTPKL